MENKAPYKLTHISMSDSIKHRFTIVKSELTKKEKRTFTYAKTLDYLIKFYNENKEK